MFDQLKRRNLNQKVHSKSSNYQWSWRESSPQGGIGSLPSWVRGHYHAGPETRQRKPESHHPWGYCTPPATNKQTQKLLFAKISRGKKEEKKLSKRLNLDLSKRDQKALLELRIEPENSCRLPEIFTCGNQSIHG